VLVCLANPNQELMSDPSLADVKPSYCILASSCDAYADCWLPFFTLLSTYWHPHDYAIFLNTETKAFAFPDLRIHCPRVGLTTSRRLSWSDRLLRCLDAIPYEIVLYLQEDYFIKNTVDVALIDSFVNLMQRECISHISLERGVALTPGKRTPYRYLNLMGQRAQYRISTQAGLWNVAALRSYLRQHETVWEFEIYGTQRARRKRDTFFFLNEEYQQLHGMNPIPYDPTGVMHGRWVQDVVQSLFAKHDVALDYAIRGFYDANDDDWNRRSLLKKAGRRLRSIR